MKIRYASSFEKYKSIMNRDTL